MSIPKPTIDLSALVSRADIRYFRPVSRSSDGLPVGNGRMGSSVWTRSSSIDLQINRVDVFAQDSYGSSSADDCCACAGIRIDFGAPVFNLREGYCEHLRMYEGRLTIDADDLSVEVFCPSDTDVLFLRVDDHRPQALQPIIEIERPRTNNPGRRFENRYQVEFPHSPGRAGIVQTFSEKQFACRSEVWVSAFDTGGIISRSGINASQNYRRKDQDEEITSDCYHQARLLCSPRASSYTIAIASDAVMTAALAGAAEKRLAAIEKTDIDELSAGHRAWWADFWSKSYIHLTSRDGKAGFVERCYTYFLYLMASSSRGAYPPKFNGMLWSTKGFLREWGAQYWLFNTESMYYSLPTADHAELTDPYFDMYVNMIPAAETAARQRWGSKGIFIPETEFFNGPEELPEAIAAGLRALNYGEIDYDDMPEDVRNFLMAKLESSQLGQYICSGGRWAWIAQIVSSAGELAIQAWQRFERTGDCMWLKTHAYPLLKGTVEFYRNLPCLKREADGLLHLYNTNVHEVVWGVKDSIFDLAVLRACIPAAVRAAEALGMDSELRRAWREFLANLAPYPHHEEKDAAFGLGPGTWAACRQPTGSGIMNVEQVWLYPVFFEDWTVAGGDDTAATATYANLKDRELLLQGKIIALHSRLPAMAAKIGNAGEFERILPLYLGLAMREAANGLSLWDGIESQTAEHLGIAAYAVQQALLQSAGPRPGEPPVLTIFPTLPENWDCSYSLLARGGFTVNAGRSNGHTDYVHITSKLGNRLKLKNPWSSSVSVCRNGTKPIELDGDILEMDTRPGESVLLLPAGMQPDAVPAGTTLPDTEERVWSLNLVIAGKERRITVGLEAE